MGGEVRAVRGVGRVISSVRSFLASRGRDVLVGCEGDKGRRRQFSRR